MPRVPFLFKATENIPHTPGSSLSPFLYRKESAVKPSPCVATHIGRPAMRRPRPNLHPQAARLLGIRLMYAPPYRHVPHTPLRPLVVCGTPPFAGAKLYCSNLRMGLRQRFIMDIAQGLSVFPLVFLFALPVSQLIDCTHHMRETYMRLFCILRQSSFAHFLGCFSSRHCSCGN